MKSTDPTSEPSSPQQPTHPIPASSAQGVRPFYRRVWFRCALFTLAAAIGFGFLGSWSLRWVPLPQALFVANSQRTEILDRHGRSLREIPSENPKTGRPLSESSTAPWTILATLAAEDSRFFSHSGVDWRSTFRAALQWIWHRRVISGGSTITQQLIKMSDPRPRTLRTKAIEALQALRLEQVWDKERILVEYLNRLPFGNQCIGLEEAAQHYFIKSPADLTLAEAALLAGLPQSPSRLNPRRHWDRAKSRQEWILGRCLDLGWITQEQWRRARIQPLTLAAPGRPFHAPHFLELLERLDGPLDKTVPPVRTTLDLGLHQVCESILRTHLARLKANQVSQGSVVVLSNLNREVLALVGSADWHGEIDGQINGAWIPRSPGSALKPFTYLMALTLGATAAEVLADVPTDFPGVTGRFAPLNYDRLCHGPVRLRTALASSLNIPAVQLLQKYGGPSQLADVLKRCGFTTLNDSPDHYGLGLTLGNAEVRLIELANAYATLACLGAWQPLRWRLDSATSKPASSDQVPFGGDKLRQVFPPTHTWLMADMLQDPNARVLGFGSDNPLNTPFPVACKTGTSSGYRDNWAMGYTPEFTVAVWTGNFDGQPMLGVSGVSGAAPILLDIFQHLHMRYGVSWYQTPPDVSRLIVHPVTGHLLPSKQASIDQVQSLPNTKGRSGVSEYFLPGQMPRRESSSDYDAKGRIRLGPEYAAWLSDERTWNREHFSWDQNSDSVQSMASPRSLRILSPTPGLIFYLDPDLPVESQRIALRASTVCDWESATLLIEPTRHGPQLGLVPGQHQVHATDPVTGEHAVVSVEVREL